MRTEMNKVVYACTLVEKIAECDDFQSGLISGSQTIVLCDRCNHVAHTLPALIAKIAVEFFVSMDCIYVTESEDGHYIRYGQMENSYCMTPSKQEEESWKRGETKLYQCDYTFRIEKRVISPIDPEEFNELDIVVVREDV